MITIHAHDDNPDKEELLEQALQILARAERFQRLATDSRLSSEERQLSESKAEAVIQEFAEHCMSYSLRRSDIELAERNGVFTLMRELDIKELLPQDNNLVKNPKTTIRK